MEFVNAFKAYEWLIEDAGKREYQEQKLQEIRAVGLNKSQIQFKVAKLNLNQLRT